MTNRYRLITALLLSVTLLVFVRVAEPQTPQPNSKPTLQQYLQQFLILVAPIQIWSGATRLGSATGFFFVNSDRLYFVTNRHVVRKEEDHFFPDKLSIRLHTNAQDHTQNADYEIPLYRNKISAWRQKPNVDLAAIELSIADMNKFVIAAMSEKWLPPDTLRVTPGEDVMIVGYPLGFSDLLHNYPVIRTGAVASAYPTPFQGQPLFLVDAILHPGTSGSPVLTKPSSSQMTETGTTYGDITVYLLGVNSAEVNAAGVSTELNTVWYSSEVKSITDPSFQTATFTQP